jgi:hypothetical protein
VMLPVSDTMLPNTPTTMSTAPAMIDFSAMAASLRRGHHA